MALPPLPEDIIRTEILVRLPVKSVTRFRSVCKSWKSLFSDPEFIKDHYNRTTRNDDLIVNKVVKYFDQSGKKIDYCEVSILSLSNLTETRLFDVPCSNPSDIQAGIELLGSINGLVCIFVTNLNQFILWNPATRQAKKITLPKPDVDIYWCTFIGFCLDGLENDFKVVIFHAKKFAPKNNLYISYLYSCNSDSWSSSELTVPLTKPISRVPSTILNGVPYWNYSWSSANILRVFKFDVGSKELKSLPELDVSGSVSGQHESLIVNWKECISVLVYKPWSSDCLVHLYSLDERFGIWNKMFNFGQIPGGYVCGLVNCFKYSGEIVFELIVQYMCYDYKTNRIRAFGNGKEKLVKCFSYTPSLIFLEGMKPLHHVDPNLWK